MNEKYIPLYRKYRPQTIDALVGQEHIKKALTNTIELNKISHAYLFTGPRGTGKTSTARIFAKSLNCKNGPTVKPCGECESCLDISNSIPMDVIEIDAASNRKVEDAENILEKILYAPVHGKYKIYIIDEVHMLSTTAFNALLKTLEEPPANVIFILATTEVQKVLDTIKSRCQRFDFRRITTSDIVKHLRYIADEEKINITDDALLTIAKNSAGGMRDSIALLDQLSILGCTESICTDDINSLLGRLSFDILKDLSEKIISSKPQDAIEAIEKIYNSGNEPVQILTNLLDYFKNLLIVKTCVTDAVYELTQLSEVYVKELKCQSEKLDTHQIVFLIEKTAEYIKEVKNTNNQRLWLEVGIIDLANLAENTSLIALQERIQKLENGVVQTDRSSPYKTPPAPVLKPEIKPVAKSEPVKHQEIAIQTPQKPAAAVETVSAHQSVAPVVSSVTEDLPGLWAQLLANIQSAPTQALLRQWANPIKIAPDSVILSMKNEVLLKQFVDGNKKKMLENAVNALFGQENSKVLVRLPQSDDAQVKAASVPAPKIIPPTTKAVEEVPVEEEIDEIPASAPEPATDKKVSIESSMHSDQVNMAVDIFDGKFID